jgi:hypothetical protein
VPELSSYRFPIVLALCMAAGASSARAAPLVPSTALDENPGLASLHAGDRAWFEGDRRAAVQAWRQAASGQDPAAEAMARLRLLMFSGNLGMAVHGPRIDQALARCDGEGVWCRLAEVDYHLLAPAEVGADVERGRLLAQELEGELAGPALARLMLLEPEERSLRRLAGLKRDGLGDGLVASGGAPPAYEGTWLLGLGLLGGPGLGFGAGLHFVHPDLFLRGHDLALEAGGTSRGSAWLSAAGSSAGTWYGHGDATLSRWVWDLWSEDEVQEWRVEGAQAALGPGLRLDHLRVELGARARWDRFQDQALAGIGPELGLALDHRSGWGASRRGWMLGSDWGAALGALGSDYEHLSGQAEARGYLGGPWDTVLAGRLVGERAFLDGAPWYLQPSAGGPDVLRGAPAGRYRGRSLAAADLEWRRMITSGLEAVVFGCGAWVEETGWHPGGGLGLRLMMPPRQLNVVRLDFAVSDAGWAVTTGWGEVF